MRELSAKLTEGERFYRRIYILTHASEIMVNIQIADSQYSQIHGLERSCTQRVSS